MDNTAEALVRADPEELLRRLEQSGLRGRGGAWFPTARKWRAVRVEGGDPIVIANGAEGEPGSVKDRFLLRTRPAEVLRGLALAAHAVAAREGLVFLKRSFTAEARAVRAAIEQGAALGLPVAVRHGDDSYIVGEETALIESLEGRRPWPRPKPPLPAAVGLEGRPTLVQNVETLARVAPALADPIAYRAAETTWVSVWGHLRRPGIHEVRLGTPLARVIDELGGGAGEGVGLVFPGGPSASPLGPENLATPLEPDALRQAGSHLGTASLLVLGASVDLLAVGVSLAGFFERESCGQCPPCVMGTGSLHRIARSLAASPARRKDRAELGEVAGFMAMHGYCTHCRSAAGSVTALLSRIPSGEAAHAEERRRPCDPFAAGSPERTAIEAVLP